VRRSRQAFFPDINQYVDTPVIAESALVAGHAYQGPALVEQPGSTVVIGPGDRFVLDPAGNLQITLGEQP
jgi:N-methylhydantoinase A